MEMQSALPEPVRRVERRQRNTAIAFLLLGLVGAAAVIFPLAFDLDMFAGGGASVMTGALVCLTGLFVSILYYRRWRIAKNLLRGDRVWAIWHYDDVAWRAYTADELEGDTGARVFGIVLIAFFALLSVGLIFLFDQDSDTAVTLLMIMLGIVAFIGLVAFLAGFALRRRLRTDPHVAVIGPDGLVIGTAFHAWNTPGTQLESVTLVEEEPAGLKFDYSFWSRGGRSLAEVLIPVPAGAERECQELLRRFSPQA